MKLKTKIVDELSKFRTINNLYSGIATIFMLHRVFPFEKNRLPQNENMKVSPEFLDRFIITLKENGYQFISLDRLLEILKKKEITKKNIVFTIDDGYLDNYNYAYPIFKKHNVPFTIYITSSFPNESAILWWYILEDLIIENETIELLNITIACKTIQEKINAFSQIREIIINLKTTDFLSDLKQLFSKYEIDWFKQCKEKTMTWKQIIELSNDNLVTIGSHTINHLTLNKLSEKNIINEIIDGNGIIEEKIIQKVNHFAYPFGSRNEIGKREYKIFKKSGIKTATTTRNGNIFHQHINHLESLPRIMLTENFDLSEIGKIRRKRIVSF